MYRFSSCSASWFASSAINTTRKKLRHNKKEVLPHKEAALLFCLLLQYAAGIRSWPPSKEGGGISTHLRPRFRSPELRANNRSSPKSCVKSLCSSFYLISMLLCQASLAGPSVLVGIKTRFLPKPSVQLLSPPYDWIPFLHQERPCVLRPFFIHVHQNRSNQAFR
ncbi:hypothetical protein SDC9_122340 [bioreactor metagenome]|uniref:Uncharacterized protein n=1 Tax=bioreactor metagenome TaxID=1076179 RepID=A0A645CEL4_9ZZZZ